MSSNQVFSTVISDPEQARTTMNSFIEFMAPVTEIDLAFQSRTRWDPKQQESFINSCCIDMNVSKFVLVDVQRCRDACTEGHVDWNYFNDFLKKEVKYLNIDSNNRTVTINAFIRDKIEIRTGTYYIASLGNDFVVRKPTYNKDGSIKDKGNNLYSTMDPDFRQSFLASTLSLHMIVKSTREQLNDVFSRMNSGESLNFFEKINCAYSDTCAEIRDLTSWYADPVTGKVRESGLFKLNEVNRRKVDGWFAWVLWIYVKGAGPRDSVEKFTQSKHRAWYDGTSVSNKHVKAFVSDWKRFTKLVGEKANLFHYKWVLFDLFYQICEQKSDNKRLLSSEELQEKGILGFVDPATDADLVQDFIDMFTILANNKDAKWYYDPLNKDKKPQSERVPFPFKQFTRGGDPANYDARAYCYEQMSWDISKYFGSIDPKPTFTKLEKQGIAVATGYMSNDGVKFAPETLHTGEYDAGHIKSRANGGMTIPSNGVIEKKRDNRSHKTKETVIADVVTAKREALKSRDFA